MRQTCIVSIMHKHTLIRKVFSFSVTVALVSHISSHFDKLYINRVQFCSWGGHMVKSLWPYIIPMLVNTETQEHIKGNSSYLAKMSTGPKDKCKLQSKGQSECSYEIHFRLNPSKTGFCAVRWIFYTETSAFKALQSTTSSLFWLIWSFW